MIRCCKQFLSADLLIILIAISLLVIARFESDLIFELSAYSAMRMDSSDDLDLVQFISALLRICFVDRSQFRTEG